MQQRYYDPIAGRFLSVDPITTDSEIGEQFSRYSYARSNPYRYVDPDGRAPKDKWYGHDDKDFKDWVHQQKQDEGRGGAQNYSKEDLDKLHREWKDQNEPRGKGGKSGRGGAKRGQSGKAAAGLLSRVGLILTLLTHSSELNAGEEEALERLQRQEDERKENEERKRHEEAEKKQKEEEPKNRPRGGE
jgi:uncharacterized protein RhaS with RHS repeats